MIRASQSRSVTGRVSPCAPASSPEYRIFFSVYQKVAGAAETGKTCNRTGLSRGYPVPGPGASLLACFIENPLLDRQDMQDQEPVHADVLVTGLETRRANNGTIESQIGKSGLQQQRCTGLLISDSSAIVLLPTAWNFPVTFLIHWR